MNRKTPTLTRAFVSVLHAKTSSAISAQLFVLWLLFSVLSFVVGQNSSATASPTKSDSYFAVSSGFPSVGSSVISSKSTENVTSTSTPSPNPPVNKTSIVSIIQSSNFAVVGSTEPITLALSFTSTPNSTRTTSGSESVQSLLDASTLSIAGSSEPLTLAVFTSSSLSDNSNSSSAVNSSSVLNNQGILSSSSRSSSSNSVNLVNSTGDASSQAESTSIGETVSTSRTVKLASKETATRLLISSSDVSSSSTLPKTNTSEFGTNVPASTLPQVPSRSRASTGAVNQSGTHQPSTQIPSISFGQSMTSEVESQYYGMSTQEIFPHSTTSQTVSWSRFHTAVESSSSRQTRHYAITSVVSESIATSWPTQGSNKPLASSAKVLSTTIIALSSLRQGSEASSRNQIAGGTASSYLSTLKLTTGLASVLGSESSAVSGLNLSTSLFIRNDSLSSTNVFSSSHFFLSSGSIASHYSGSAANLTQGPRSKIADATHALSVTLKQQTTNQGSFDVSERSSSMKSDSRGATISSTSLQGNQSSVVTENSLTPSTSSSDKSSYVLSTFGSPIKATSSPFMYTDLDSSVVESTSKSPVSTMFLSPSSRPSLAHISPIMQLPFSKESLALSHSSLENSTTMSESISGVFHSRNRTSSPTSAPTSPATTLTSVLSPLLSSHFQSSGIVLGDQSTRLYQSSSIFTVGSSITGYPTQSLRTSAFIDHSLSVGNTTTVSEVSITGNMSSLGHQTVNRTSSKKTLLTGGYLSSRPSTSSTDDLFSEISAKSFASSYLSQSGFTVSTITRDLATAFVTSSESHPTDSFPTMSKSIIKSSLQSADQTLTTSSLTLQSSRLNKTSFSTRKEQSAQPTIRSTVALQTTTEASSEIVFPAQTTSEFNTSSIPAKVSSFATVPSSSPMVSQSHNLSSFLGEITSSLPSKAIENKTVNPGSGGLNVTSLLSYRPSGLGTSSRSPKSRTPVASVLTQTSLPTSNVFFSVVSDKATSHRSSQKHTPLSSSSVKSSIVAITGVSISLVTPTLPLNQSTEPLDSFSLVFGSPSSLINATLLFMQSMSFTSFPKRTELSPPSTSVATNQPPSLITRSEKPSQPTYKDQSSRISSGFSSLLATIQSVSSVNATVFRSLVTSTEEFRQHTLNASSLQSSSSTFSSLLVTSTGRMETVVRSTAANKSSLQITGPVLKTFDHTFSASTESGASTSVLYTASTQSQVTSRISQSLEAVSNQSSMPMLNSSSTEFKPTTLFSLNTSATVREMSATYIMGFSSTNDRSSLESTILPSFQTLSHQSFAKSSLGSLSISAVLDMTQSAKSLLSASTTAHDLSSGSFMSSNISARGTVATTVLSARVKSSLSSLLSNPNTMTYLTLLVASTSVETRSSLSSSSTFSTQGTRSLSRFWTLDSLSSIFTRKTSALQRSSPVSQPRSLSPLSPSALHSMSVSSTEFSDSFSSSGISTNESETSTLFPTFTSPRMTHSLPLSPNTSIQPSFQVSLVYLSSVLPTASLVDATVFTPLIPSKLESDASLSSAVTSNATSSIAASFQTSKVPSQSSITGAVVTPSISAYGTNLTTVITSIISSSRLNRTSVFTETRSPVNASASLRGSSFALKQSTDGHMLSLPSLGTSALRSSRRTSSLTASSFFYVSLSKDLIVSSSVIKASLFSPGSSNSSMVPSFSSSSPSVLATTNQTTRLVNSESLLVTINSSTLESLQSIRVTDTRITLRPTDKTSTLPSSPFYSQSAEQNSSSTVERPSFTLQRSSPIPSVGKTVDSSVAFTLNSSHSPASVSSSSTSRSRSSVNSTSVYRLSTGLPESSPPLSLTLNVSTAILSNMTSMTPSSTLPHKRTEFATPLSAVYESVSRTTNATLESSKSLYFSVTSDSQRTLTPLTKTSVYYSVSASRMYNVSITLLASFNTTISSLLKSTSSGLPETISFIITNVSMTRSRTSLSVLSSVASSLISAANVSRSVSQNPTDEVSSSTPLNVTPPASVTRVPESYGSILSSIINTSSTTGVSSTPGFPPRPTPSTTSRDFVSQSLDATRNITATSVMESTSQMTSGVLQSSLTISLTKRSSFATESIASSNLEGSHIPVTRTLATPVSVSNIPVISSLASSSIQLSPSIGTVAKSSAITGTQDLTRTFDLYSSLATNVSSIPDSSSFVPVLSSPLSEESSRLPPLPTGATVGSSRKTNLLSETRRLFSLTLSRDSKSSVALRTDSTRPYNPSSLTIKTSEKQSQSSFLLSSTIPIATSVSTKLQTFSTNMTIPAGQSSGRDATIQTVLASSQTIVADETSSVLDRSRLVSTSVTIKTLSGALTLSILSSFVISSKQAMIKSSSFTIAMPSSIWPRKSSVEPSSMSKRSGVPSVDLPSVKTTTLFSESKSITLSLSQAVMTSSSLSVGFPLSPPTRSSQVTSSSQEKGSKVVVTLIDLSSVKTKTSISNIMRTSMLTSKSSTSSHIVMTSSSFPIVLSSSIGPVSSLIGTSSLDKSPGVVVTEVELSSVKTKTPITRSTSSTAVIASETYASSQVVKKSSSFIIGLSSSVRPKSSSTRISSLDKTLGVGVTSVHVSSAKTERLTVGTTKTNVVITTKTPSSSEVASSHLSTTQLLSLTLSEAKSILTSTKAVATSSPKRSASSTNPSASVSNSVVTPTAQSGEGIVGIQILVPISENEMNDSFRIVLEERLAAAYRQGLEKGDSRKRRDLGWIVQEFFGPDPTSFTTKDFRRWKKTAAYKVYERQNKRFRRQTDNIFAVINTIRRARPIVGEEVVDVYYRIFDGPDMLSAETVVETTNRLTEAELVVALKYGVILRPYVVKEIEVTPNPGRTTTPASLILTIVVPTVAVLFLLFALLWIKFAAKRKKKKTKVKPEKKRRNLGIQVVHENDVFPPKMPTVIYANPRRKHSSTSSTSSTSSEDLPSKLPVPPLPDYPQTPTQEKPSQQYRRRTTGPPQKKLANDKTIERDARGKSHRNVEYSVPTKKPARVAEKIEMKNLAGVVENRPQMREEKLAYNYPRDEMSVRFTALPPLVETSLVGPRPNNEVNGEEEKSPRERIILDSGVPQANVERWRNKMRHREKLRQELREKERERDKKLRKLEKDDKEITYNQNAKASSLDSLQRSLTAERKRRSRLERWRNNRVGTSSSKSSSGSNSSSSSSSESELEDGKRKKTKQYRERKDKESRTKPGNSQNVISGRGADEARKEAAWTIRETPGVRLVSVRPRDEDTESRHSPASEPVYPPNGVSGHKIRQPRPVSSRSQQRDRVHYLLERAFPVMPVMPRHVHTSTDQYYPDDGLYEDLEELDPNVPQYDEDLFMENETFRSGYPTRRKQAFGGPVLYDDDHIYEEPTLAPVSLPQTRFVSPEEYQGRFLVPTQYARAYGGVPHPNRGRPPSAARRPGSARPARSARSARPSSAETEPMARYAPPPAGSVPYSRNANPPSEPNARQMFSNRPTVATAPQPSIGTSPRSMVDPERRENLPNSFDGARANLSRAKDNVDHFERDSTAGFPSATARSATAEPRYARPHKSRGSEPTVRLTQTPSSQRQLPAPNTNSRLEMAAMERAELEAQLLVSRALARARTNEWRSNTQSTTTVAKKNLADKTRKESRTENENKKHRRKQSVDSSSSSSSSSTGSSSINDTNKKKKKSDKEKKKTRNAMSARKAVIRPLPAPNMKPHYGKNKPTS